jgi:undecaprenyl-diphosphatase
VPLARLEQASVDARGSTPYFAMGADGRALFVKALGEDQRSADLLFRVYRWANRRDLGDERPFSSLRRGVEHEALVALAARDLGVRTPRLVAFATAEPNAFVLAYEAIEGRSLDRLEPDEVTDAVLVAIWEQVGRLREHRIAHRDLRLANVFLASDGAVWLIDFGFSELAASSLLLTTDAAELLASSTLQVGPERAVAVARQAIGPVVLGDALERLHPWALSGATRTGLKSRTGLLEELRSQVAAAGGIMDEAPASEPDRVT